MYALSVIATQPGTAPKGRPVVVRAESGNGMTFDLPRGS
jgi:hypothetical protein